ncbi:MAG: hypothetical protein IPK33_09990 [Gemmatimonadetes bacterium]|nr:hypothetical protein [Gemmatimonadota bacterium]
MPGDGTDHVQIIDVRDLVEFRVTLVENRTYGVFNGVTRSWGCCSASSCSASEKGGRRERELYLGRRRLLAGERGNPYGRELPVFQVMKGRTAGFARFDLTPRSRRGSSGVP